MNPLRLLISLFILLNFSCDYPKEKKAVQKGLRRDSIKYKETYSKNFGEFEDNQYIKTLKQIWGYRFVVNGDFDGDGKKETLTEHFISGLDKKECCKFYDSLDYDRLVAITVRKEPISFMLCENKKIDTLHIYNFGQLLGVAYMKNEGDLDGDGGDEISYVIYWADWSALNSCHITSYKNGKWKELYSFDMRDWVLPDLPEVQNQYYLFGVAGVNSTLGNDTLNERLEKEVKSYPGLIKKIKSNIIEVQTLTGAEDTVMTIDLRHPPKEE